MTNSIIRTETEKDNVATTEFCPCKSKVTPHFIQTVLKTYSSLFLSVMKNVLGPLIQNTYYIIFLSDSGSIYSMEELSGPHYKCVETYLHSKCRRTSVCRGTPAEKRYNVSESTKN